MNIAALDGQMLAVISVSALVFFVIVWIGLGVTRAREDMNNRLAVYGRATAGTVRDEELSKPLAQRTIGPVVLKLSGFLRRFTPVGYLEKKQHQLVLAGNPGNLDAPSFIVIKLLTTVAGLFAAFFLSDFGSDSMQRIFLFGLPIVLGFFGPDAWLQRKVAMIDSEGGLSGWRLLMMMTEHDIHHRSQIDTYAGLNGWDVPHIYGRSAEHINSLQEAERAKHGVIPGSLHAPYTDLAANVRSGGMLNELARATGKRMIFYCAFGERSAMAVRAAQDAGLACARHIEGGVDAWKKAGGPLVR